MALRWEKAEGLRGHEGGGLREGKSGGFKEKRWGGRRVFAIERLLFNANSAFFLQPYHGEKKLIFNEMMMRSALF